VIVFLVAAAALSTLLVLLAAWYSDRWEREPVSLVENVLLLGLAVELVVVLLARWWFGFESWAEWALAGALVPVGVLLPSTASVTREVDEPFDGIVYSVAFACGSSLVLLLWDLPVLARTASGEVLEPDVFPGLGDLAGLLLAPHVAARLGGHLSTLAAAALIGGLYGYLQARTPRPSRSALTLSATALAGVLGGLDLLMHGSAWFRVVLAAAAIATASVLKTASPFKRHPASRDGSLAVTSLRTALLVTGAAFLALCVLAGVSGSDRFKPGVSRVGAPTTSLKPDVP
jgi:hypothetical protein